MFIQEYPQWKRFYLPFSMRGLTVLDVGAGEGETARFFLENGAKKIVCIEPNHRAFEYLLGNARHRPMECFNKRFDLDDLVFRFFDFMKMDIEGYEEQLLGVQLEKPSVIEIHGLQLRDKFNGGGYMIKDVGHDDRCCTCYAYWGISHV
jgi:SAM-dependent methyltransferase